LFNVPQFDMLSPDACAALQQHCHHLEQKCCPRELIVLALKRTSSIALTALLLTVLVTSTVYKVSDELRTMCNILSHAVKSPHDILHFDIV